eukprot:scaffold68297_cov120-Phaeocystis_antarctica.AAC.10
MRHAWRSRDAQAGPEAPAPPYCRMSTVATDLLVAPLPTALASWGGLSRLLAAPHTRGEPLSRAGPNGRLQCGP